jgi:hypothetical protein
MPNAHRGDYVGVSPRICPSNLGSSQQFRVKLLDELEMAKPSDGIHTCYDFHPIRFKMLSPTSSSPL